MKLKIGDIAPEFKLKDQNSNLISLEEFKNKKNIILFFYPKDFSPLCTSEVCEFQDSYEIFKNSNSEVLGISADNIETHKKFSEKYNVSFSILSDNNNKIRKLYGAFSLAVIPARITFIIDKLGIIKYIFSSNLSSSKHIKKSLEIVSGLK